MFNTHKSFKSAVIPAVISSILGLSGLPSEVKADEYVLGLTAYENGEYSRAFELFKLSAESGTAKSQLILSTMYRQGVGIEQNEYEGFYWCKQAAEQEFLEAKFQLGIMYIDGEGVSDDEDEAIKWLWDASSQGYPQATEMLQYVLSEEFDIEESNIGC